MELTVKIEDLRKRSLFVCTPMYGGNCLGLYAKAALDLQMLCAHYGINIKFSFLFNESLITRARNYLVDEFLRSDCSHLMFIDSDIHFDPQDIIALLALDRDIIGAPYPKKQINWRNVWYGATSGKIQEKDAAQLEALAGDYVFNVVHGTKNFNVTEPLEVMEIGTGFMMIKREVFEPFRKAYPQFEYRPDHIGQPNFDGSRTIHAYFDTVIDETTKRYLSEDYMFCGPASTIVETECGPQTIKKIVDSRYSGNVISFNQETQSFEWNKISDWISRPNGSRKDKKNDLTPKKKWVRLDTTSDNNAYAKLRCTEDHSVAFFEDIFDPRIAFGMAKDMTNQYVVRFPDETRINHRENRLFNTEQMSVLVGIMMGDGNINKFGQFTTYHSEKQREYLEYSQKILNGGSIKKHVQKAGFGKDKTIYSYVVGVNEQTRELRNLFYSRGKKEIGNILPFINEISLAFWYMDDGSLNNGYPRLATNRFTKEENELLQKFFSEKWQMTPVIDEKTLEYKGKKRTYYSLRFLAKDSNKFFSIIAPYIPSCMEYKLPISRLNSNFKHSFNNERLAFSAKKIKEVKYLANYHSRLYDITVENNHNFVANRTIVHNCQYARKIGYKIWMCPWMKLTHVGTYPFRGDMPTIANITGRL